MRRDRPAAGPRGIPIGLVLAGIVLIQAAVFGVALLLRPSALEPVQVRAEAG